VVPFAGRLGSKGSEQDTTHLSDPRAAPDNRSEPIG